MIRAGEHGPVKIGFAEDVALRMTKMQADNHERLTVIRMLVGGVPEEVGLHALFADHRLHGEWFSFSRRMLGDIGLQDLVPVVIARSRDVAAEHAAQQIAANDVPFLFPERLRIARKAANMTQRDLSDLMGVGRSNIAEYENGKYGPSSQRLSKLAQVLGVSMDWLLAHETAA